MLTGSCSMFNEGFEATRFLTANPGHFVPRAIGRQLAADETAALFYRPPLGAASTQRVQQATVQFINFPDVMIATTGGTASLTLP
jgi:hypothetical protein